jgi:hypothetical protein
MLWFPSVSLGAGASTALLSLRDSNSAKDYKVRRMG